MKSGSEDDFHVFCILAQENRFDNTCDLGISIFVYVFDFSVINIVAQYFLMQWSISVTSIMNTGSVAVADAPSEGGLALCAFDPLGMREQPH